MIMTAQGAVQGIDHGTYTEYRGIPYAKAPVGPLRWKAPEPAEAWEGVLQATDFRCRCLQEDYLAPPFDKDFYSNPDYARPMSEDCLYLHIWAPNAPAEKLPVAFWVHGGAFMGGYSSEMEFDGAAYCARGVILVSVEYRCNVFGFLAHPWLSAENERHISGNYGILDQIAALNWVYDNIGAFGGDRNRITAFGQSAGAMSVQTMVSSPLTEGKIAGAILQSGGSYGGGLLEDVPLEQMERYGVFFAQEMGCRSLEEMRALSTDAILKKMIAIHFRAMQKGLIPGFAMSPVIDGYVLTDGYNALMDRGEMQDIPYLLGTTKDDIMTTPEMVKAGEHSELYQGCIDFSRKLEALGRKPAWVYYFDRNLPGDELGAWHSSELWYTFGTLERCWRPWEERDFQLSRRMLDYWTNFIKTGDPNGQALPLWEPCTEGNRNVFALH